MTDSQNTRPSRTGSIDIDENVVGPPVDLGRVHEVSVVPHVEIVGVCGLVAVDDGDLDVARSVDLGELAIDLVGIANDRQVDPGHVGPLG